MNNTYKSGSLNSLKQNDDAFNIVFKDYIESTVAMATKLRSNL